MTIFGSCLCGLITYKVAAPLENARSCHCSRCRKAFGGAASAYAEVNAGAFEWTSGEDDLQHYRADADWGLVFCKNCGSALAGMLNDQVHGIMLGPVDGDPDVEISMHIHIDSKAPWDHIGGTAPQFNDGPTDDDAN